jgi:M6 family metalloprotease-like protein
VNGTTLVLTFDETIASVADVAVTAYNGASVPMAVLGVSVSGATGEVTLASPATAADAVVVDATVLDGEGNETKLVRNGVTNLASTGVAPTLAKASFADDLSYASPEYGEWPIDHDYFLPATDVRIILLFADFTDKQFEYTPQRIRDAWVPVASEWFKRASFGQFALDVDWVDQVYNIPKSSTDYGGEIGGDSRGNLKTVLRDAMELADADVDFSEYDAVWIANPLGYGVGQYRAWPGEGLVFDGKEILHAQFPTEMVVEHPFVLPESGHLVTAAGAAHQMLTHELGHHLGLPDLSFQSTPGVYEYASHVAGWDQQENPAGMWRGADYFAWSKWRLGWLEPRQIRGPSTSGGVVEETLSPVESAGGVKLLVAKTTPSFLYAVEVRRRLGNDAGMTCDEGVLVYRVDSTVRNGLGPKYVFEAFMGPDTSKWSTCGHKYAAPYDLGPGERSSFENDHVEVEVLATDGVNYRVRVTQKPDAAPPALTSAAVDGWEVTARFSEPVVLDSPDFTVDVGGTAYTPGAVRAEGSNVLLTLPRPLGPDESAALNYDGGVEDGAGNATVPLAGVVVANAALAPCSHNVDNGGLSGPGNQNEGATDLNVYRSATGTRRAIVLPVSFPDAPGTESLPTLDGQLFQPTEGGYASMSYGELGLQIDVAPQWYQLPQTSTYYQLQPSDGPGRKDEYIAAAILQADATIDFSQYDFVYLIAAVGAAADHALSTQRPPGQPLAVADGNEIRHAVLVGSTVQARTVQAVLHETGHVFGLPDLYGELAAIGGWDPMGHPKPGPSFIGWHRWKLGWLEPEQRRCVGEGKTVEAALTPIESGGGVKTLVAPLDAQRALVIEHRQPIGRDALLCDEGALVYTVNGAATYPGVPIRVHPAQPGTDTDDAKRQQCGPIYNAPLDIGPGEVSSYSPVPGIEVTVIWAGTGAYVVRVAR